MKSILEALAEHQGKQLDTETGDKITALQNKFIQSSLASGREQYMKFLTADLMPGDASSFFSAFEAFFSTITTTSNYLKNPAAFKEEQLMLYKLIHEKSNLSDEMKLFCEFLIGLARFVLTVRLQLTFLKSNKLVKPNIDEDSFLKPDNLFDVLNNCGRILTKINTVITQQFVAPNKEEAYWALIAKFLSENPTLDQLAQNLLGLHYVPDNPNFITLAQILHWKGWGGTGDVLSEVFSDDFPELLKHCIHYISDKQAENFTQVIANVVGPLSKKSDTAMEALLKIQSKHSNEIRLCDIGSGPLSGMVTGTMRNLQKSGLSVSLDALDICEFANIDGINKRHIYYDANSANHKDKPPANKLYDACCAGYVLHQLTNPAEVLKTMLAWTKPGGFVMTKLITPGAKFQFAVVPINLVDREGHVGKFSLEELSISLDNGDIKFLCPLTQFDLELPQSTPAELDKKVWGLQMFTVIECKPQLFNILCRLWSEHQFDEFKSQASTASPHSCLFRQSSIENAAQASNDANEYKFDR